LPVANGGTGSATLTTNNVLLGNGTSALQVVAPGTVGNVLTSNGTTWTSGTAGGVTSAVAGNGIAVSGSTGAVTFSLGAPTRNSIGSYQTGASTSYGSGVPTIGSSYSSFYAHYQSAQASLGESAPYAASGTWLCMSHVSDRPQINCVRYQGGLFVRIA